MFLARVSANVPDNRDFSEFPMTEALPRNIAGLAFSRSGRGIESRASEGFWALWRHNSDALRALGLRPSKRHEGSQAEHWIVTWSPGKVAADVVDQRITDLQLALFASQRKTSESEAIAAQRTREVMREQDVDREQRTESARRKLAARFGDLVDTDLIAAAQAQGRATWQQWHSFCVNKKRMLEFSAIEARISLAQAVWLTELVDQTAAKASHMRDNLSASDNAVDWLDDEVVAAVESLCRHDSDQAREGNGVGWSKAHSSRGHWCMGMIKNGGADRMIGIDAARALVGKYSKQLARGEAA